MTKINILFYFQIKNIQHQIIMTLSVLILSMFFISDIKSEIKVIELKAPNGGVQPQAVMDDLGNLHLIYFTGDQGSGNLFYVTRLAGKEIFSSPIQVNSIQGSAVSAGTIRGGQISLGKGNRVHVAWNGSKAAKGNMQYARLNDAKTGFEAEQSLMNNSTNLDGGGSVAADDKGNVYVVWHGNKIGGLMGEEQRQVWMAISKDEGKTFAKETPILDKPTGVCGCCALHALVDKKGTINIMYRSASNGNRDVYLLVGKEGGKNFQSGILHSWKVAMCPMSTMSFAEGQDGVVAAWQTEDQIYFSNFKQGATASAPKGLPGIAKARKHPSVAINKNGEMIIAWTEGTGWARGGDLVWQMYDNKGNPTEEKGRISGGIPVWGLPTVVSINDGFLIIH